MTSIHHKQIRRQILELTEHAFRHLKTAPLVQNITDERKACLIWAYAVMMAGKIIGGPFERMCLQGGSAAWRIVTPELDDGVCMNQYAYLWHEDEATEDPAVIQTDREMSDFPEVHFWAAVAPQHDPEGKGLIVDVTTQFVPSLAADAGLTVSCCPPNCVYAPPDDLPENCMLYRPFFRATVMGSMALRKVYPSHFRK